MRFVFTGSTKKIAYAGRLEGVEVVPIQGMTAIIDCTAGITGVCLFLDGRYAAAFLSYLIATQVWRFFSEFLRADYRGGKDISTYQVLGFAAAMYSTFIALVFPARAGIPAQVTQGISMLWNPLVILFLQGLRLSIFLYWLLRCCGAGSRACPGVHTID